MDYRMQSQVGPFTVINGRERDYFCGCGYLGLQSHPNVLQAIKETTSRYGFSTATSRGGYGEHPLFEELEGEARAFFDAEAVLYYPTGYLGSMIVTQGLRNQYEHIFVDEQAHYSVMDGANVNRKPVTTFKHRDAQNLKECIQRDLKAGERPLVMSDAVFPITGEIAPVPDYVDVVKRYNGWISIDDAHGVGVLGDHGRGVVEHLDVHYPHLVSVATLSKALGGYGGIMPATSEVIEEIRDNSHVLGGVTPTPLPAAAASRVALNLARNPMLRKQIMDNVYIARNGLRRLGWQVDDSPVPIICLAGRPGLDLGRLQEELFNRDIAIAHVKNYSGVPVGGALRIAIFATHSSDQIERLIAEMSHLL
jgi:8-amino-7-oxononanoate synthase